MVLALTAGAAGHANVVANGDFTTGDLTDWTVFTTGNGTVGAGPEPDVAAFDVTGGGPQDAAVFNVGALTFDGSQQGGGIEQTIVTGAGNLDLSAAIAAYKRGSNAEAGVFSLILDGATVSSDDLGPLPAGQTLRATVSGAVYVTAGTHDLEILITRPYLVCGDGCTPNQYVTDINATISPAPEPAAWAMMSLGTGLLGAALRRRRREIGTA